LPLKAIARACATRTNVFLIPFEPRCASIRSDRRSLKLQCGKALSAGSVWTKQKDPERDKPSVEI
jgi:hypothetical protein